MPITLYTHATPNGHKVSILLEELGLPYTLELVDLSAGEQHQPQFLALNPNGKIPVIVDPDGPDGETITVFESGAILIYLARKTGSPLLPRARRAEAATLQWLMFQMANVGPLWGQAGHFVLYAGERVPYAVERYTREAERLLGVLDRRLAESTWLAGDAYTIADIAVFPWLDSLQRILGPEPLAGARAVSAWRERLAARPAVQRGLARPARD